jgi:uncharacterized protein YidB (DUF937 family)
MMKVPTNKETIMGLLDAALGMINGQGGQGGLSTSSDPKAALLQAVLAMLTSSQGQGGNGLSGLLNQFNQAGLGNIVSSWIGTGQNMPISADQIQDALGGSNLGQLADSAGLSQDDAAQHLSEMLPGLVDKLTPNGQLPQGDNNAAFGDLNNIAAMLGQFTARG